MGFIDSNGIPQEIYYKFLDQTQSKTILASAIKNTYADLFALNTKANEMSSSEVKNKLKTLTQGSKSDIVLSCMANTFTSLCKYADFSKQQITDLVKINNQNIETEELPNDNQKLQQVISKSISTEMHYNIQIHLPESRDITVYDAIFKSLKEHLL